MTDYGPSTTSHHVHDCFFSVLLGNLTQTTRTLTPSDGISPLVTKWGYNRASRVVKEVAPDGKMDSTVYDPAGNPIRVITRRSHHIVLTYDALNRLKERRTPGFVIPEWSNAGIPAYLQGYGLTAAFVGPYPMYGTDGYRVHPDTAKYTYDAVGNILTANNRDARVTRTYYRNGLIKTETQRIRTQKQLSSGGDFTHHVYTLTYTYDGNGRRKQLQHPAKLAPRVGRVMKDKTTYAYNASGELAKVTDVLGHEYRFTYTPRTELDSIYLPRGVKERFTYDLDGNIATHVVRNASGVLVRNLTLRYDGRARLVKTLGVPDSLYAYHSGLGYLVKSSLVTRGVNLVGATIRRAIHETFTNDALSNLRSIVTHDTATVGSGHQIIQRSRTQRYVAATARLAASDYTVAHDSMWYDAAGNLTFTYQSRAASRRTSLNDRASFYDAEGRLRAADHRYYGLYGEELRPYRASFETYRYDALGRRVWVRARRMCGDDPNSVAMLECQQSLIRRTLWDGDRELWEIQMPGQDGSTYMENDTVTVDLPRTRDNLDPHPFYGRVTYTHGVQLDQPLGVTRIGYVDFKRGMASRHVFQPFTFIPGWSLRGDPDRQYIAESGISTCTELSGSTPCVWVESPMRWWAYGAPARLMDHWYGTLIERKADKAGTFYRRNRYYDAATGRFTQEDPIGLAGGMNLYGFADGDPINFSDPFGLCPPEDNDLADCPGFFTALGAGTGALLGGLGGGSGGLALCAVGGPAAVACAAGGGIVGASKGAALGAAAGAAIDAGIFIFSQQADAVERAERLRDSDRGINTHMGKLRANPGSRDARHWAGEIRGQLKTIERLTKRMKGKTQEEWRRWLDETRRQMGDLMRGR